MKRILLISSVAISMNPRLLKNYLLYRDQGYDCEILAFKLGNWTDQIDRELIVQYKLKVSYLDASRNSKWEWVKTSVIHLLYGFLENFSKSLKTVAYVSNKRSIQITHFLKNRKLSYDLIEAHTLATLYPAYRYSVKRGVPFLFDVEDFHPFEHISKDPEKEKNRRLKIMQKCLNKADQITTASPLISETTADLIPERRTGIHTINNSFYQKEFVPESESQTKLKDKKIKLVWFSQYISFGRGLELIIDALEKNNDDFELSLIGNVDQNFYSHYNLEARNYIKVIPPLKQSDLHRTLADFDIGLALELSDRDANRDICLTNKLFAYVQAGLFVLCTNTSAQKRFLKDNGDFGLIANQNPQSVLDMLLSIKQNIEEIRSKRELRFRKAKELSYDNESQKLLRIIESIIG